MPDMYIKGPVLSPGWIGRPDIGQTDRPLTGVEIQKAAYNFPIGYPIIDVEHEFKQQAIAVELYVASQPEEFNGKTYNAGTLWATCKVTDPAIQAMVNAGELNGFSVGAFPEKYRDDLKSALITKGLFESVKEGDWFALAISLVKEPFYPDAIFKVFGPDEFIKKSYPNMEVDNLTDESKTAWNIVDKLLDKMMISKSAEEKEDKSKYSNELEERVKELKDEIKELKEDKTKLSKKVDRLTKKLEDKEEEEPEDKEKEDKEDKKEEEQDKDKKEEKKEEEAKENKETEEVKITDEAKEEAITKSLDIDSSKKQTSNNTSFLESCGCDALGRNKKYL